MDSQAVQAILSNYGYWIVLEVGKGAFSTCYHVVDEKYNRDFICKVLEIPKDYEQALLVKKSYYNEVNALVECIHPNVIKIYKCFIEKNYHFIILEYCNHGSIYDLILQKGPLKEQDLFKYTLEFANGLSYCHSMGIANHDVKPANLLLGEFNKLKIADFGFASLQKYLTSEFMGSLAFMSPEKISGFEYNPFLSDVWSFGISLYYMATANLPFYGLNTVNLKRSILGCTYQIPNSVPIFAKTIIMKTLVLKPADRWTMSEVIKYMRSLQGKYISRNKSASELVIKTFTSARLNKRCSATRLSCDSLLVSNDQDTINEEDYVLS